jgi:TPR repeat protein
MRKYITVLLLSISVAVWAQDPNLNYRNAQNAFESGNYEEAINQFKAYEALSNQKATAEIAKAEKCRDLKRRADSYFAGEMWQQALNEYNSLLAQNPKDSHAQRRANDCQRKISEATQIAATQRTQQQKEEANKRAQQQTREKREREQREKEEAERREREQREADERKRKEEAEKRRQQAIAAAEQKRQAEITRKARAEQEDPLTYGEQYYNEGRYADAKRCFETGANDGDADCQNRLGRMYADGTGVPRDYDKAMELFMQSAQSGNVAAENNIGKMYEQGLGRQKNAKRAASWYRKSATKGFAVAQYNLGRLYETGDGVNKSLSEARKWYRLAANQGLSEAKERLEYIK